MKIREYRFCRRISIERRRRFSVPLYTQMVGARGGKREQVCYTRGKKEKFHFPDIVKR